MRLFIAIQLPKEVQDYLAELQQKFSDVGKITFAKESHLTLKFIGETSTAVAKQVEDKLLQAKFYKFKITLSKIGVFPNENLARVIWVGIEPEKAVKDLQQQIDTILKPLFPAEKEFKPHLTLGRIKFIQNKKLLVDKTKNTNVKQIEFEVQSFALIKSPLEKAGPEYSILKEYQAL